MEEKNNGRLQKTQQNCRPEKSTDQKPGYRSDPARQNRYYRGKGKAGKRVKEVVNGKKTTVYDEVQKEIKKDAPSKLHARRQMAKVLYPVKEVPAEGKKAKEIDLTDKLFNEIAPKYANRNGGYTRIVKIGLRKGDAAMEVVLELV